MLDLAHPFNDQRRWADPGIWQAPSFGAQQYQKKLDQIAGVAPSGHSIVRLVWAWDARKWENTAWDNYGNATAGEWRQKYRTLTVELGNGDYVDISPPRWILEERYEPVQVAESWERTRYRRVVTETPPVICRYCHALKWISADESEGHILLCRFCRNETELASVNQDVWGAVPREGWYTMLPNRGMGIIAEHRNNCCQQARELEEICWGYYKEPGALELKRLRKAIHLRNREMATNPHIRPELDTVALEQAKRWGLQVTRDIEVRKRGELAEIRRAHRNDKLNIVYSHA